MSREFVAARAQRRRNAARHGPRVGELSSIRRGYLSGTLRDIRGPSRSL